MHLILSYQHEGKYVEGRAKRNYKDIKENSSEISRNQRILEKHMEQIAENERRSIQTRKTTEITLRTKKDKQYKWKGKGMLLWQSIFL